MAVKFFISYSHDEYTFKDELIKYLRPLENAGQVEIWTDEQIVPGQEWDKNIRGALLDAGIIIFMVSNKFIDSRYIHEVELKDAIGRYNRQEVILIPVILENIEKQLMEQLPLNKFEPLPVVNKKVVPITEWRPQSGAYDNILNGLQRTLNNLPVNKGPYSEVAEKLRKLYKGARYEDIFKELDKLETFIGSRDIDLLNTYQAMRGKWKQVKLDNIRRTKNAEENSQAFSYQLIDFITALEKELSGGD